MSSKDTPPTTSSPPAQIVPVDLATKASNPAVAQIRWETFVAQLAQFLFNSFQDPDSEHQHQAGPAEHREAGDWAQHPASDLRGQRGPEAGGQHHHDPAWTEGRGARHSGPDHYR